MPEIDEALPSSPTVSAYGVSQQALNTAALESANGTYGASCIGRTGSWSVAITQGASLDNSALAVAHGNSACQLTLTALRTGAGASNLYTASSGIVLGGSYAASGTLFSASGASFYANAKHSATDFRSDFAISLLHSADASLVTGSKTAIYPYHVIVETTPGLVSYWRLDESGAFMSDNFTGTSGSTLESRSGALGASWTRHADSTASRYAYISSAGRARVGTADPVYYYSSGVPSSADYSVEATIRLVSKLNNDQAMLLGRTTSAAGSYYTAGYSRSGGGDQYWSLRKGATVLAYIDRAINEGVNYRATLVLRGPRVRLLVDGEEVVSYTDASPLGSAGKAGLLLGRSGSTPSDSAGVHIDDMVATPLAKDFKGVNDGVYVRGVTLGASGALTGNNPANASATFDGVDDYIEVDRGISDDFSIEFWFKSTQGVGTGSQWWEAAGLVDGEVYGYTNDFGVSLRADGKILAGTGNTSSGNDTTILSGAGFNNGQWHHVVFTRVKSSGALVLYVDGTSRATGTGNKNSLNVPTTLSFGRQNDNAHNAGQYFNGSLDEVAVYSTALSAATVLQHYNAASL